VAIKPILGRTSLEFSFGLYKLMVETTLLAIAKTADKPLDGLPYWWNMDDPSQVLSDAYFGTYPGLGDDYQVIDGAVANFDINDWSPYVRNMTENTFVGNEFG
jgi:hypothetical protein